MKSGELYRSQLKMRFKFMKKNIIKLSLSMLMIAYMNFGIADGNPYADGYYQDTNPYGDGYIQGDNAYGDGYIQDTNPYGDGYIQDTNPYGDGYVQDKGIFYDNLK